MKATLIGASLCAATFMVSPAPAQSVNDGVTKSPVQIEVRRAQDEDGSVRGAMKRPAPTTTGSGASGPAIAVSNVPECKVITVRSPQPGGSTIIRKLRQCS